MGQKQGGIQMIIMSIRNWINLLTMSIRNWINLLTMSIRNWINLLTMAKKRGEIKINEERRIQMIRMSIRNRINLLTMSIRNWINLLTMAKNKYMLNFFFFAFVYGRLSLFLLYMLGYIGFVLGPLSIDIIDTININDTVNLSWFEIDDENQPPLSPQERYYEDLMYEDLIAKQNLYHHSGYSDESLNFYRRHVNSMKEMYAILFNKIRLDDLLANNPRTTWINRDYLLQEAGYTVYEREPEIEPIIEPEITKLRQLTPREIWVKSGFSYKWEFYMLPGWQDTWWKVQKYRRANRYTTNHKNNLYKYATRQRKYTNRAPKYATNQSHNFKYTTNQSRKVK